MSVPIRDHSRVLARIPDARLPVAVWVDVSVERDGRRASVPCAGMRASVSHRVVFDEAPPLARFSGPGGLSTQPWFGRDALRTAASWAGTADGAAAELADRPASTAPESWLWAGCCTITAWLERAGRAMDASSSDPPAVSLHGRAAIAEARRTLLDEAARACGSHPFAVARGLDRVRRDLELFLLRHRLDPALAVAGADTLDRTAR